MPWRYLILLAFAWTLSTHAQPLGIDLREPSQAQRGTLAFWFSPVDWDNRMIYAMQQPQYVVPLLRGLYRDPQDGELHDAFQIAAFRMSENKGGRLWIRFPLQPGSWYHVALVWEDGRARLLVNGEPADGWTFRLYMNPQLPPEARLVRLETGDPTWWRSSAKIRGNYRDAVVTEMKQLQLYGRALSPPELANLYQRDLPNGQLRPLPASYYEIRLNQYKQNIQASFEVLAPSRDNVRSAHVELAKTDGEASLSAELPEIHGGRADLDQQVTGNLYGEWTGTIVFRDAHGESVVEQALSVNHPAPPWYGNTLGLHPGQVLPGWEPIQVQGGTLSLKEKRVVIDGRGWPTHLTSAGKDVVDQPIRLELAAAAGQLDLQAAAEPKVLEAADDRVMLQGVAASEGWKLTTTASVEFDGFIKLTTQLEGPPDQTLTRFLVDIPLSLDAEQLVGFWAGNPWFRGACDYRLLPAEDGVVFRSNATGRQQPEGWKEKVSFLPFISVTSDDRGLFWLAENDQNWSQSWTEPAQEIVREGRRTWLRLHLVHEGEPLSMKEPRTFTFALQTSPVRPPSMLDRQFANDFSFGMVDGFNGHTITADHGSHLDFRLAPEEMDWEAVAARSKAGRGVTQNTLLMYLDRNSQRAPEDAREFISAWRGGGNATDYSPVVRDCFAWYQNEYLRRGLVDGFYIDDCWTKPTKAQAPSYLRHGEPEWGFAFFDFREALKRLRWLFHDNGLPPRTALHITQTLYLPVFGFADLLVDGEDRFPKWGQKRDFIDSWGLARLRYSTVSNTGLPTTWMNAIGNKEAPPGPMPKWRFRQIRSFVGLCAVSGVWPIDEVSAQSTRDLDAAGCTDGDFIGYWDATLPIQTAKAQMLPSLYRLPDRLALVLLNTGKQESIAELALDLEVLHQWLGPGALRITDMDSQDPPEGEDVSEMNKLASAAKPGEEAEDEAANLLGELQADVAAEEAAEADPFSHLNAHNSELKDNVLRARVRAHDYRLLQIQAGEATP